MEEYGPDAIISRTFPGNNTFHGHRYHDRHHYTVTALAFLAYQML